VNRPGFEGDKLLATGESPYHRTHIVGHKGGNRKGKGQNQKTAIQGGA